MAVSIAELRKIPREELIKLVGDLWETRPGWRVLTVEPGEVEVEIDGERLEVVVPVMDDSQDVSVDLLAIQEEPYVELEYIHVRQAADDDMVEESHLRSFNQISSGYRVRKSVIVTTGPSPEKSVDKRLYRVGTLVEGAKLRELVNQCSEYGFDFEQYL